MHKLYPHERFFILALLITAISGGAWFYEPLQEYLTGLLARAAGVISNTPKSPASAQSSLVGHWTFDGPDVNWRTGVVSDKAGTNNGQMRGTMSTSTSPVAGVHGQGLKFDGVDDSIDVSSVAGGTAFTATDNFTLTAWIRPSALPSAGANIVGRNTNSNGNWFLRTEGNNLRGGVQDVSGNGAVRTGTTVLIIDRWYFATMVYTGSTKTTALFLDAVSEGTAVNASLSGNLYNTNNVSIGKRDEGAGDLFSPSSLDDVRIYNRALTADEITALYRAGSSAKLSVTPKSPASAQSSLVGHWTFDGPDVNWRTGVVSDKAGTNNGQMQGTMSTSTAPVVGVHGQGLAFDGSDDNIKLDANISNFSGLARGTVSMWFNIIDPKLQYPFLTLGDNNPTADAFWQIGNDSTTPNRIRFIVRNGGVMVLDGTATQNIVPNRWYHVAVTNDTNGNALYINGAAEPVSYSAGNAQTDAFFDNVTGVDGVDTMRIGTRIYGGTAEPGTPLTNGSLDDVRIYNRALTADEITALYRAGSSAKLSVTPKSPASAQSSLIGHWTFDGPDVNWRTGVVSDKAGTNNGQMLGTMSTSTAPVAGVHGQGLKFDGVDDYITIANESNFDQTTQLTVAAWTYFEPHSRRSQFASKTPDGGSANGGWYWDYGSFTAGQVELIINGGSGIYIVAGAPVGFGAWHHVAGVVDTSLSGNSRNRLYVDGVLQNATYTTGGVFVNMTTNNEPVKIGTAAQANWIKGSLDDVRIYNRALTADEITALYRAGR